MIGLQQVEHDHESDIWCQRCVELQELSANDNQWTTKSEKNITIMKHTHVKLYL